MQEINKFNVQISDITNGSVTYMAFIINKICFFIDSTQFMSSSLDALVKNLSDNDFEYLFQEFSRDSVKLVKQYTE